MKRSGSASHVVVAGAKKTGRCRVRVAFDIRSEAAEVTGGNKR